MSRVSYPSFLTREESTALKGLLILLVVLGHNSVLTGATGLFPYLYSFHVYCFYILPFLYGFSVTESDDNAVKSMLSRFWRYWKSFIIIYLFWCLLGILFGTFGKHISFQPCRCLQAILWGHQTLLTDYCGFSFLWFLPTIIAVMFWRDVYFLIPKTGKVVLFLCCVGLWGLAVVGVGESHTLGMWCPLALIQGLFFSMAGIAVRFILEHLKDEQGKISRYFVLLFLLAPLYVYLRRFLPYGCVYLTWSCCPIVAFVGLYAIKDWLVKVKLLQLAGKYSLQIYLLHTIIFNILLQVVKCQNVPVGIAVYLVTLLLCTAGIWCAQKSRYLKWAIFPRKAR